jgi:hypothetical protein
MQRTVEHGTGQDEENADRRRRLRRGRSGPVRRLAARFERRSHDIIHVDRHLTHIWKPLLHEVAAGSRHANPDDVGYGAQGRALCKREPARAARARRTADGASGRLCHTGSTMI